MGRGSSARRRLAAGVFAFGAIATAACVGVNGLGSAITDGDGGPGGPEGGQPPPPPPPPMDGGSDATNGDAATDADADASDGATDATLVPIDYFLGGSWSAEWWDETGAMNNCPFQTDGGGVPTAQATSTESAIDFPRASHPHWQNVGDSPATGINTNFCGRLTRSINLPAGTYTLSYEKDDGIRVLIDGTVVRDDWTYGNAFGIQDPNVKSLSWINSTSGTKTVVVLFSDTGSNAVLRARLVK